MSLFVEKGVLTAPAGTGTQAITLTGQLAGKQVKALKLWATYDTADVGAVGGDCIFSMGFGTYRGAVAQQYSVAMYSKDAVNPTQVVGGNSSAAILRGFTQDALEGTALDYVATLTSLDVGGFTLNWTDAPASQIRVHYLALGGLDITDAIVGGTTMTTGVATQDVALASFGRPDLLMFMGSNRTATYGQDGGSVMFGVAKSDTERRSCVLWFEDGNSTGALCSLQKARAMVSTNNSVAVAAEVELSAVGSWPADGFQLSYPDQANGEQFGYLALKGTFLSSIISANIPTSGPPNTQNYSLAGGSFAKGALFFSTGVITNAGRDFSSPELGAFTLGATDGSNEGHAYTGCDDNTAMEGGRGFQATKAFCRYQPAATPTLQSEADSSISANTVSLVWNDVDSVATEYSGVILGSATESEAGGVAVRDLPLLGA